MPPAQLLGTAARLLRVRLTKDRFPVAARFNLTESCTSHCLYCRYQAGRSELPTERWKALIEAATSLGVRRLSFSGGEPCLRSDLLELVEHASAHGVGAELNTSGAGFQEHQGLAKRLSLLKVSLDGPPWVHERMRGREGSFDEAMAAVDAGIAAGTRTILVATVSAQNVEHLDFIAQLAASKGAWACFQPLRFFNPSDPGDAAPATPHQLHRAFEALLAGARDGRYHFRHSHVGLRHASHAPDWPPMRCWAGHIFFIVHPDGTVVACDRSCDAGNSVPLDWSPSGRPRLQAAIDQLGRVTCSGCGFSGATELNLLLAGRFSVAEKLLHLTRRLP